MTWQKHGEKVSKKLTQIVKGGHARRIVITDKHNTPVLHFPVLFFIIVSLFLPLVVGVLIFLFLISEYHAVVEGEEK